MCSEYRLRNFPRSKSSLFICLLKRHIACWRQSLSMWLPVSFWSEQRLQTKGLFVCLWIYIMNIINIFCKWLKNPERFIMSCLWADAVESCSSFRRFLRFFLGLSADDAFSFQLSTFWKHFSCINFCDEVWRRQEVGCLYFFLCFIRALRETTGLDLAYKTLDMDVIDEPRLGGFQSPLMNINHYAIKTLHFRCQFPICVMGFKLTTVSVEKPASTREKRLRNWKNPICQLSIDLIIWWSAFKSGTCRWEQTVISSPVTQHLKVAYWPGGVYEY